MTREEAIGMLKAKLECMIRDVSGSDSDCNSGRCFECNLNYAKGNMGEQKEYLRMAIKALDQEPKMGHWIRATDKAGHLVWECDKCEWQQRFNTNYCPDCGAKMVEPPADSEG